MIFFARRFFVICCCTTGCFLFSKLLSCDYEVNGDVARLPPHTLHYLFYVAPFFSLLAAFSSPTSWNSARQIKTGSHEKYCVVGMGIFEKFRRNLYLRSWRFRYGAPRAICSPSPKLTREKRIEKWVFSGQGRHRLRLTRKRSATLIECKRMRKKLWK